MRTLTIESEYDAHYFILLTVSLDTVIQVIRYQSFALDIYFYHKFNLRSLLLFEAKLTHFSHVRQFTI